MSFASIECFLALEENPLIYMNRGFKDKAAQFDALDLSVFLAIVVALLVAVWLTSRIVDRIQRKCPYRSPLWLFLGLCRAHRLSWREGRLLWQVARAQRLESAARLFLEPERLDAAKRLPALTSRTAELESLGRRLFAESGESQDSHA